MPRGRVGKSGRVPQAAALPVVKVGSTPPEKGKPLRSLVFNLLHDSARQAGCSDQAWEIIAEFAAAEALLDRVCGDRGPPAPGTQDRLAAFLTAAEALLACMGHQGFIGEGSANPASIVPGTN